jgi:hypothetical protein
MMQELQALQGLDTVIASATLRVYVRSGREAAIAFLVGFWYGTGVRYFDETRDAAAVFGLSITQLGDRSK